MNTQSAAFPAPSSLKVVPGTEAAQAAYAEAARIQHFHYNTMRYRIQKLERLVGPFTSDSRLCLQLAVALQILSMPELAGT